jgi:hypothetical protein
VAKHVPASSRDRYDTSRAYATASQNTSTKTQIDFERREHIRSFTLFPRSPSSSGRDDNTKPLQEVNDVDHKADKVADETRKTMFMM